MMTVAILESQILILPSPYLQPTCKHLHPVFGSKGSETYPTAYMSGSALLRAMFVTSALQPGSFHRLRSSPFFTSQQNTSSSAPTTALPAPEFRRAVFSTFSSGLQIALEVADVTIPKVLECSYFLLLSVFEVWISADGKDALTSRISPFFQRNLKNSIMSESFLMLLLAPFEVTRRLSLAGRFAPVWHHSICMLQFTSLKHDFKSNKAGL